MTKADIVERLASENGFTKAKSLELVESVLEIVKDSLASGETVRVSRFGSFIIKEKNDRRGRNPVTGEEIRIAGRRVLTFKPSVVLKGEINKNKN